MSEFKPIESQEQLDAIIGERIKRAEAKAAEKYSDYDSLKTQITDLTTQVSDLTAKLDASKQTLTDDSTTIEDLKKQIKNYETRAVKTRIAHEVGLPYQLADKLSGDDEKAIKADAENMVKLMTKKAPAPLGNPEPVDTKDPVQASMLAMAKQLSKQN